MLSIAWQDERPTEQGDYYVSIAPEQRRNLPSVIACEVANWAVDMDGLGVGLRVKYLTGGMWLPYLDNPFFDGAKWAKRQTPSDPFAAPQPVAPHASQVWQKLNVGTKTASKAPRITVIGQALDMVSVKDEVGQIRRMRITTLQRDWYCLNP